MRVRSKNEDGNGKSLRQKHSVPVIRRMFKKIQDRWIEMNGLKKVGFRVTRITTELSTNNESLLFAKRPSKSDYKKITHF